MLPSKGKMSRLQGNRMAVSVFFDKYNNQGKGLEAIRGDAESIQMVLEDKRKFRYKFPSEDNPTLFEPHQFRPRRWSIFQSDGMVNVFFQATIDFDGFSMVLTPLDHHH